MKKNHSYRTIFTFSVIFQLFLSLVLPGTVLAQPPGQAASPRALQPLQSGVNLPVARQLAVPAATSISVSIASTPWATLDHNTPGSVDMPRVYVVEAVVTNTGAEPAVNLLVTLDYNEDPAASWVLLSGEDPERSVDELAPGESYHAYWFASYSYVIGASHTYTVSALADNAVLVSTSDNAYGNPAPGKTVMTRSALSTGNSGITQVDAQVTVGVAFTMTVTYNLGLNPLNASFGPVGNTDFNPGAYRLISTQVRFFSATQTLETVDDRLYFPTLVPGVTNAEATYTFLALAAENTHVCSYAAVGTSSNVKYDQFYCDSSKGTNIPIEGTVSLTMNKLVSSSTVLQNDILGYTIEYTNTGSVTLTNVWIWDDIDPTKVSIQSGTVTPAPDPLETTSSRIAWYIGNIPASGEPGSSGVLSFSVLGDGNGLDLSDGVTILNESFFGINPGSLPNWVVLTSSATTTVLAPRIEISKTDGITHIEPGGASTYTIQVNNTGSIPATSVVITDILPAGVTLNGDPNPLPDDQSVPGTLVWNSLSPLAAGGEIIITVPVLVDIKAPNGTTLSNQAKIGYQNASGHVFQNKIAVDMNVVNGPVLSVSKSDSPDPVLTLGTITYTLSYANTGPAAASNVVITDVVPLDTTYYSCSGGTSCGLYGDSVSWDLGTLAAGASGTVAFSVLVSGDLLTGAVITNGTYGIVSDQTDLTAGSAVTTTVNRDAATYEGYTFIDANGNGIFDGGEGVLEGVSVSLPQAFDPADVTDVNGYFEFRVEYEVPVSISAAEVPGYFRTTPGTILDFSTLGTTRTVNFGYAPDTAGFSVVYGTVYQDDDHNETFDLGEMGISGVQVSSVQAVVSPVATDGYGAYTLRFNLEESVTITETNPAGYVSTTPDTVNKDVLVNSANGSPLGFGDFLGIQVTGQVFADADVDGVKDPLETGLAGATVSAGGDSLLTDSSGNYNFFLTLPDSDPVQITETDPAGYVSTNAIPGAGMERLSADALQITAPVSGQVYTGGDFGDAMAAGVVTIQGTVWDDNGSGGGGLANGMRDGSEPGLAGATVSLSTGLSQVTGPDGTFVLYAPTVTPVTLTETNPSGYQSTNALPGVGAVKLDNDTLVIGDSLTAGSVSNGHLFGDVLSGGVAVIRGKVFDDQNESGALNLDEPGLPDVQIMLEFATDPSIFVLTNASGEYEFAVAPGTDIRLVTSSGPGGAYYPTSPETLVLQPPAAGIYENIDFGYSDDSDIAIIYGVVFDDSNSNGFQDLGESGLVGADVSAAGTIVTTAGGLIAGTYAIPITSLAGTYTVQETNPPGYRSTTPDTVNVQVVLGHSYRADFGDTNNPLVATIYGVVFDDLDRDGEQDDDEPGLPGVEISVTVGGGSGVVSDITKAYGQFTYALEVNETGYHRVSEQDPALPGYRSTTPDEVIVFVELGQSYVIDFGDAQGDFTSIFGTVFNDASGEGVQNLSELGIPGVQVSLSNGMDTTTNQYGGFGFTLPDNDLPLTLQVMEQDPVGYHSTTPNTVTVFAGPSMTYQVDFGDFLIYSCTPDAFEEDDAYDQAKEILSGIGNAQARNFCEDAGDWVKFTAQAGMEYTIETSSWGQGSDTYLTLYDTNGQTFLQANDDYEGSTDFSSRIVWSAVVDGIYYIQVSNRSSLTHYMTDYDLWIEAVGPPVWTIYLPFVANGSPTASPGLQEIQSPLDIQSPLGVINHICPDSFEMDDTYWEAKQILPAVAQLHSFDSNPALYAADKDWVWFEAQFRDTFTFTVSPVNGTPLELELFDENGLSLGISGTSQVYLTATEAGRYYLSVSATGMDFGCSDVAGYELTMEFVPTWELFLPLTMK